MLYISFQYCLSRKERLDIKEGRPDRQIDRGLFNSDTMHTETDSGNTTLSALKFKAYTQELGSSLWRNLKFTLKKSEVHSGEI